MINVKGREPITPESERYLGTNYDSNTAERMFVVDRICAEGVDLAALNFCLDLVYDNERDVYTVTKATTITDGYVWVNTTKFLRKVSTTGSHVFTYNGTNWAYSGNNVNLAEYGIVIYRGIPASGNTITVTLAKSTSKNDTVWLDKSIGEEKIYLLWTITEGQLQVPGTILSQIRAYDEYGSVRWSSYVSAFYVDSAIDTTKYLSGLSNFEALETKLNAAVVEAQDHVNNTLTVNGKVYRIRTATSGTGQEGTITFKLNP